LAWSARGTSFSSSRKALELSERAKTEQQVARPIERLEVPDAVSFNPGLAFNVNVLEAGSFNSGSFDSSERGVVSAS
jgi:hypothetical protein